jgi:membrane fusion protein (multidrug efflux system)
MILVLGLLPVGCGSADDANAATDDSTQGAEPAKSGGKGEDDASGEGSDAEDDKDEADKKKEEEAVPVEVTALELGPIESVLRFSANLEAEKEVKVFSQAKRLVTELLVEEGDRVSPDQLLLRLQNDEQKSALTKVESQLAKAGREYERQDRLYKQDLISEEEFNNATYELEQLRISLEDAQRELGYTEVGAPIAGTITSRLVNLGDQVQIGQHLFDMVDFDSIVARVYVPEQHLRDLRQGLPARIGAQAAAGRDYRGEIERISPIVDPKSGTVKVTVAIGGQPGLRPGMYVDVDLVVATHSNAILVPKRALVYDNDQMFVFRLDSERRVERIFIEPSLTDKFHIEPLAGLSHGDQIVVAGQAGLKDGALVSLPEDEEKEEAANEEPGPAEQARL